MLLDLDDQSMWTIPLDFESSIDRRQRADRKCNVHNRTVDRDHAPEPAGTGVSFVMTIGTPNGGLHHGSMHHQEWEVGMPHRMESSATENHLFEAIVGIAAHDQEARLDFLCCGEECVTHRFMGSRNDPRACIKAVPL
jgi:hypothetical protein